MIIGKCECTHRVMGIDQDRGKDKDEGKGMSEGRGKVRELGLRGGKGEGKNSKKCAVTI